jgi:hypothetical protein
MTAQHTEASILALLFDNPNAKLNRERQSRYLLERHGLDLSPLALRWRAGRGTGPHEVYIGAVPHSTPQRLDEWVETELLKPEAPKTRFLRARKAETGDLPPGSESEQPVERAAPPAAPARSLTGSRKRTRTTPQLADAS